ARPARGGARSGRLGGAPGGGRRGRPRVLLARDTRVGTTGLDGRRERAGCDRDEGRRAHVRRETSGNESCHGSLPGHAGEIEGLSPERQAIVVQSTRTRPTRGRHPWYEALTGGLRPYRRADRRIFLTAASPRRIRRPFGIGGRSCPR